MKIPSEQALTSIEQMLVKAADSLINNNGRHNDHQILFTVLTELLSSETIYSNIQEVLLNLKTGLNANRPEIQQSSINIINSLLGTDYTIKDRDSLLKH